MPVAKLPVRPIANISVCQAVAIPIVKIRSKIPITLCIPVVAHRRDVARWSVAVKLTWPLVAIKGGQFEFLHHGLVVLV